MKTATKWTGDITKPTRRKLRWEELEVGEYRVCGQRNRLHEARARCARMGFPDRDFTSRKMGDKQYAIVRCQ